MKYKLIYKMLNLDNNIIDMIIITNFIPIKWDITFNQIFCY